MKEVWVDIVGFEGDYQVSNFGRIKSLPRFRRVRGSGVRLVRERIKVPGGLKSGEGYLTIGLTKNGVTATCAIHVLVARHFVPNPDNLPQVNHKDTIKRNNRWDNLEWTTHQGNSDHAVANGLMCRGEEVGNSKYTEVVVRQVLTDLKEGKLTQKQIALKNKMSEMHVSNIKLKKAWGHLS